MKKILHASGKRKTAVAKATLKPGRGQVRVNSVPLANVEPKISRMKISEPLVLAGDTAKKVDIKVTVSGGGVTSQAEAARLALGRVLSDHSKELRDTFLEYDRTMLVADVRRKESSKPNRRGAARSKRQKSYR